MFSQAFLPLIALLAYIGQGVQGEVTLVGCMNAFIHLKCEGEETLEVTGLRVENKASPTTLCPGFGDVSGLETPREVSRLCATPQDCVYKEEMCTGKNECVFYVAGQHFSQSKQEKNLAVQISYGCKPGSLRIAGVAVISVITIVLVIAMAAIIFTIWRGFPQTASEDYHEFENRLSRTPSMSSEISAKFTKNGNKDSVEVKIPSSGMKVPPKVLDEKTASVI